ncbi:ribosome hibernation-promoting factor, HPF/YfiA family [Brevibacillus dissolubilis]|uniref:ribosome hibernation-promoting factor, HPF/YfiA family n=1 Tax=Brevibacillus dissolubilis TaxID=1844116 RepID=UPI001115C9C7|nr:ribosome-associated translation inhibitor RaiA [Brevibacillus dissolubilis]
MNFHIRGENIQVTAALRDYAEKKIGRLDRYFDQDHSLDVHVTMRVLRGDSTIEVSMTMGSVIVRAEETHEDMYAAIDLVTEKLERQMRKHKTKLGRKIRVEAGTKLAFRETSPVALFEEDEVDIEIVRTKRFDLKPMDSEEAVLQMDMLGHNFFVFHNSETDSVNVVYRRNDGKYGLIEPA